MHQTFTEPAQPLLNKTLITNLNFYVKGCFSQWSYRNKILHPGGNFSDKNE